MTDELFGNENIPWPEKGDQLFTSAEDWWHNACLNYMPNDWEAYILGYKRAGDILVENVKETRSDQDVLVYPIVFLYRQYIELRLKQLIQSGKELLDKEPKFPKKHELDILWNEFRPILSKVESSTRKIDLDAMGELMSQFCTIDPTSVAFRYPVTKDGGKVLSSDIRLINLRHLSDTMEKIAFYFDSAAHMISVYIDHKHDIEAEFGEDDYGGEYG